MGERTRKGTESEGVRGRFRRRKRGRRRRRKDEEREREEEKEKGWISRKLSKNISW